MGYLFLQATHEGEQLCAMLAWEGKVDAVFSTDTDLLVYATPLVINDFGKFAYNPETKITEEYYECVQFDGILDSLKISYNTFVDLCIMSGCDYNDIYVKLVLGDHIQNSKNCECIEYFQMNII